MTVSLMKGDAVKLLSRMTDASIDLIVTDPPYPRAFESLYSAMAPKRSAC